VSYSLRNLDALEAEAIHTIREVAAAFENPVLLYSIGKDSMCMLHVARKAFAPGPVPFALLHIDTTWNFREMIEFRDRYCAEHGFKLINAQAWQPQSSALASGGAMVAYTYEVGHPYAAVLTKVPGADSGVKPGYEESIALFIQPVQAEQSRVWFRMALADFELPAEKVLDFQNTIFLQDKPVLESQRPRLLPLKPGAESFVAVDKGSAAYRRLLQQLNVTFGVC